MAKIWTYIVYEYDIIWYYMILHDYILRASLSEENCTMEFPAKTLVGVISLCSFSAGCWVTAPSLDTWIYCNLLIFTWYYTDIYMHRSGAKWPLSLSANVRVASIKAPPLNLILRLVAHTLHTLVADVSQMSPISLMYVYQSSIYAMWMYNYYCIVS